MRDALLAQPVDRLAHLLAAWRGIARALNPDPVISEADRVNLYYLCMLLIEEMERCLDAVMQIHVRHMTAEPETPEGDAHEHD
jgi:hypothetical protein